MDENIVIYIIINIILAIMFIPEKEKPKTHGDFITGKDAIKEMFDKQWYNCNLKWVLPIGLFLGSVVLLIIYLCKNYL